MSGGTDLDALLRDAKARAIQLRRLPESTYRLQFHKGFTFTHAAEIVPYLASLGITHVYASPYLRAAPGSTHGYDVIDHCRLNPELGSQADFERFVQTLADHEMTHILDTVPNHSGVATNENRWWNDVMEHGPASPYGHYFDIAWQDSSRPEVRDRILVPILGEAYAKVLEQGLLKLSFDQNDGSFAVSYYDRRFPIDPGTYDAAIGTEKFGDDHGNVVEFESILTAIRHLPDRSDRDPSHVIERQREAAVIKRRLKTLATASSAVRQHIQRNIDEVNGRIGDPHSFDTLDRLLSRQCYRLANWQIASDEINYRRFFDINDLAALSMERRDVFEATHALTLKLLADGKVAGLRIDHPDGLYDPAEYFRRLQQHFVLGCARYLYLADPHHSPSQWEDIAPEALKRIEADTALVDDAGELPLYVVAEKILAVDERLPRHWAIHGTSGYHFLNMINGLFVDTTNAAAFSQLYGKFVGDETSFDALVFQKKELILHTSLSSELQMLSHRLGRLARKTRRSRDFTHNALREALAAVISCFPVYRTYITGPEVDEVDCRRVEAAVSRAQARNPKMEADLFDFIGEVLKQRYPDSFTAADRSEQIAFAGKFQQLTAPVTAKGVEDTAFYVYNRLVSLNEVGGDPDCFGIEPDRLHGYLASRQRMWPHGLSALSTHDTKRSEDVRARLNLLSEVPEEWSSCVLRWRELNAKHRVQLNAANSPSPNEEYLIYQSLLGAWPLEPYPIDEFTAFVKRVQEYIVKAMREAKVRTSWIDPDLAHEKAVQDFVARVCDENASAEFLAAFRPFQRRIARLGLSNSLSQTLLKLTCPGAPDTYQGSELWDFSLVDPDNRRPVDYRRRQDFLHQLDSAGEASVSMASDLMQSIEDGQAKLWITSRTLRCRRAFPGLFSTGEYLPVEAVGAKASHVFAFARRNKGRTAIVAVSRLLTSLSAGGWGDTMLKLPESVQPLRMYNLFTGASTESMTASELFSVFPVALLVSQS